MPRSISSITSLGPNLSCHKIEKTIITKHSALVRFTFDLSRRESTLSLSQLSSQFLTSSLCSVTGQCGLRSPICVEVLIYKLNMDIPGQSIFILFDQEQYPLFGSEGLNNRRHS